MLQREADGGNPFAGLPGVLVTPHIGGVSRGAGTRILQMALANIGRVLVLAGQAPQDLLPGLDEASRSMSSLAAHPQQQAMDDV